MMLGDVRDAYLSDSTGVHSVTVSDIYRCVCMGGEGVPDEVRIKVAPWIGRRYFAVQPEGVGVMVLYTQASQVREHWEEDMTRRLVLFVPCGAMARLSRQELSVPEEEAQEYEKVDLRKDLILWHHDFSGHLQLGPTLRALKQVAYWPGMSSRDLECSVQYHIKYCAHCISRSTGAADHGLGIDSRRRGEVMQMDHLILTDEEAVLAECLGSLELVDVASRMALFVAVDSQSAEHTARVVFRCWLPVFGVPTRIISDPHSGFASEVMAELLRMIGAADHEKAAARSKGSVAIVERLHLSIRAFLDDGFEKGDITCRSDFEMYLSSANQHHNLVPKPGRIAPIMLWTGQHMRTVQKTILRSGDEDDGFSVEDLGGDESIDEGFVGILGRCVNDLMDREMVARDDKARSNALRKDKALQKEQDVEHRYEPLQEVSHMGTRWTIAEDGLHGEQGHPVTATLVSADGKKQKRALVTELKPLAVTMPVKMYDKEVNVGHFVMWKDDEGYVCGGTVEEVMERTLLVWCRQQDEGSGRSWRPCWTN